MVMVDMLLQFLLPVFVVVVLPVSIVLIVSLTNKSKYNKKISFFEKCVEKGVEINPQFLEKNQKRRASLKIMLLNRLMAGVTALVIGILLLVNGLGGLGWPLWMTKGSGDAFFVATIIIFALGIGLLIWYFVGRKMLADDLQAEHEELSKQHDNQ